MLFVITATSARGEIDHLIISAGSIAEAHETFIKDRYVGAATFEVTDKVEEVLASQYNGIALLCTD